MRAKNRSLIVLAVLLVSLPTACFGKTYPDLTADAEYTKAVMELSNLEIISGYPDGYFRPEQAINRAEALKIILNSFPKNDTDLAANKFPDVNEADWFYKFVRIALKNRIIEGYTDGTFKPANQVNFAEALKMGLFAKGIDTEKIEFVDFHPSVKKDDWFAKYFSFGYDKNLFKTDRKGGLNPIKPLTRGEFVELIYRIKNFDPQSSFDISYNWKDETNSEGVELKYPTDWESYDLSSGSFIAFFPDKNPDFVHKVDGSAKIAVTVWNNSLQQNRNDYFQSVKEKYTKKYQSQEIVFNEKSLKAGPALIIVNASEGVVDSYVYVNSDSILVALSSFDPASQKSGEFIKEINKIIDNLELNANTLLLTNQQKIAEVRKNILVANNSI